MSKSRFAPDTGDLGEDFRSALGGLARAGSSVLLAVSGGSDSVGMLHLAASCAGELGLRLGVGYVDHGQRAAAADEWRFVRTLADEQGLTAYRVEILAHEATRVKASGSRQDALRRARYALLGGLAREIGCESVATAHTRDDQAETILLRLLRGTGIDGLGGIPPAREIGGGVEVIRPLLFAARDRIRGYLRKRDASWIEDPSNLDPAYARVRVRRELLPLLENMHGGAAGRLAALADECRGTRELLDGWLAERQSLQDLRLGGGVLVPRAAFERLHTILRTRLIRAAIARVKKDLGSVERVHIEAIERALAEGASTGEIQLPGDSVAYAAAGSLWIFPAVPEREIDGSARPEKRDDGSWVARFEPLGASVELRTGDRSLVEDLELRSRRRGDRLEGSKTKLKERMIDAGLPRVYRPFVPVMAGDEGIVACPEIVPCRRENLELTWIIEKSAPIQDILDPTSGTLKLDAG
ncbi:MAG: tRNA lysidine(34) synthetase TilS [Polyangia bacterium]